MNKDKFFNCIGIMLPIFALIGLACYFIYGVKYAH